MENKRVAAILIRGLQGIRKDIKDTLFMLRLRKKNSCVVLDSSVTASGMLIKAKDFITYGVIDKKFEEELEKSKLKRVKADKRTVYFLHPPRGGFEKKGIKQPYNKGGALGDRKDKMHELIKRMM